MVWSETYIVKVIISKYPVQTSVIKYVDFILCSLAQYIQYIFITSTL